MFYLILVAIIIYLLWANDYVAKESDGLLDLLFTELLSKVDEAKSKEQVEVIVSELLKGIKENLTMSGEKAVYKRLCKAYDVTPLHLQDALTKGFMERWKSGINSL